MNLTDKLEYLIQINGINRHALSTGCGVPYSTIMSLFTKGYMGVRLSTLQSICNYFGVTLDYLCNDRVTEIEYIDKTTGIKKACFPSFKEETNDPNLKKLVLNYTNMNLSGQYTLVDYSCYLAEKQQYKKQ